MFLDTMVVSLKFTVFVGLDFFLTQIRNVVEIIYLDIYKHLLCSGKFYL